jgi:hypothetical protein
VALCAAALMAACGASALLGLAAGGPVRFGIILGWAAIYTLLLVAVERTTPAANRTTGGGDTTDRPLR